MIKKNIQIDLGKDSTNKIFWNYAIPAIIAMLAQTTAGIIDSIFVGRYVGAEGLSAITLIMPVIMLLGAIGTMVAIGGTTLAGIHMGKGEPGESNNYFNITNFLLVITSIVSIVILQLFADSFATALGAKGKVFDYIVQYAKTLSFFLVPFLMTFAFSFFVKLDGKPTLVVIVMLSGTVINIVLDYLLVGVYKLEILGAAFATGVSQLLPWLMMLYIIHYKTAWKFKTPKLNLKNIWAMLFNGSSELLSMAAASIAGMLYNVLIMKKVGVDGIAAFAVAYQISSIATSVFYGFAEAIQTGVSYNLGSNQLDRVSKLRRLSIVANLAAGVILCIGSIMFGKEIAKVFIKSDGIISLAGYILNFYAIAFIMSGVNITLATYYTAVNSPVISAVLSALRSLVCLAIGLFILPIFFGDNGLWGAIIFAETITLIVGIIIMKKYNYGSVPQ